MSGSSFEVRPNIVGLGELLWDVYPDHETFGGAPANFACHCQSLGADTSIVSAVGKDVRGLRALQFLSTRAIDASGIAQLEDAPTGEVLVTLDQAAKPAYEICLGAAWDAIPWSVRLGELAAAADAVCFGSLGQRSVPSREAIRRFLEQTSAACLRVFDVNLRHPHYTEEIVVNSLSAANVLKLSDEELPVLAAWLDLVGSAETKLRALVDRFGLRLAILTCGAQGALMLTPEESSFAAPPPLEVVSTVGAGDAFTAAAVTGMLRGEPLGEINRRANAIAAYVCSRQDAVPPLPAGLV